jgi:hypothetical protein
MRRIRVYRFVDVVVALVSPRTRLNIVNPLIAIMVATNQLLVSLATVSTAMAAVPYPPLQVRNDGVPVGAFKNISGSECQVDNYNR